MRGLVLSGSCGGETGAGGGGERMILNATLFYQFQKVCNASNIKYNSFVIHSSYVILSRHGPCQGGGNQGPASWAV